MPAAAAAAALQAVNTFRTSTAYWITLMQLKSKQRGKKSQVSELCGQKLWVRVNPINYHPTCIDHHVGDVPMDEHAARWFADDLVGRHAGIAAA